MMKYLMYKNKIINMKNNTLPNIASNSSKGYLRYLMYKNKIINMKNNTLPNIASNSSKGYLRSLMYKNKIINMKNNRFPNIASNSSKGYLGLKKKYGITMVNNWRIQEDVTLQNINNIKSTILT